MSVESIYRVALCDVLILNNESGKVYYKGNSNDIPLYLFDCSVEGVTVYNKLLYIYIER